jgi:hypothetical protein
MKKYINILSIIAVPSFLFFQASALLGQLKPNTKAPKLSLISVSGDTVRLSDYTGKIVILHFWKTD